MNEEREIKDLLKETKKPKLIDKILESNKTEIIINRIRDLSSSIKNLIVKKLNLNTEKEGKLFIILFAIILFVMISIITLILLTPLVGIHIIFSIVKYSVVILYKIIKNKGFEIKKYLKHKFPNSNVFKETRKYKTNNNFSNIIFKEVEKLIQKMDKLNLSSQEKAQISIRLKEIILLVKEEDGTIEQELYTLNIKRQIASMLSDIEYLLQEYQVRNNNEFYNTKNQLLETLDEVIETKPKIYQKIRS